MARQTVTVSDLSGEIIEDGQRATLRVTFDDARRGSREMDLTVAEVEQLLGGKARTIARRGRKPKSVVENGS